MNEMDCVTTKDLLPEYTAGMLDGGATARVRAHLADCESCRGEVELISLLRTNVELPAGLEQRVVAAVRAGEARRAPRWGMKRYAMAATVAFAALTGSWIWQSIRRSETPPADTSAAMAADAHVLRSPGLSALSEDELLALLKEIES
jgi:anti-sigma factor RsiW